MGCDGTHQSNATCFSCHLPSLQTKWTFDDNLNGFTITSLKSIPRGEQVYDSYGRKCNSRFFVNYGFSLDDNEEDNEGMV